jgi:hypothetical protein
MESEHIYKHIGEATYLLFFILRAQKDYNHDQTNDIAKAFYITHTLQSKVHKFQRVSTNIRSSEDGSAVISTVLSNR